MAWSFSRKARDAGGSSQKTAVQLMREAAVVLALGGGFQAYYKQKRDGSIFDEQMPVMAEVARFCRARQAICHHAEQVPQIALVFSTPAHYRKASGLFSRELSRIQGTLEALLESQQSVEVLGEHHLSNRLAEYPLVVIPEWEYLDPKFRAELLAYVRDGGHLLVIGPAAAALFPDELGAAAESPAADGPRQLLHGTESVAIRGRSQAVKPAAGTQPFGQLQASADGHAASSPAATIAPLGKGRIAAVWFDFGRGYLAGRSPVARQFLAGLVRELFPTPMVEVTGSNDVDVTVNRTSGKLAVNLVNTAGPHQEAGILDSIPPVGPLQIAIRRAERPAKVALEPGTRPLDFDYRDGQVRLTLPKLEIHDIITVE
jgi:hypothetical protein